MQLQIRYYKTKCRINSVLKQKYKWRKKLGTKEKKMKDKDTASSNINFREVLKYAIRKDIARCKFQAKISSHIAKVDFPLIFFGQHVCCSELSFEKNSEILIQKETWNSNFSPFPLVLDVYIVLNTNRKMSLLIIFNDQPV